MFHFAVTTATHIAAAQLDSGSTVPAVCDNTVVLLSLFKIDMLHSTPTPTPSSRDEQELLPATKAYCLLSTCGVFSAYVQLCCYVAHWEVISIPRPPPYRGLKWLVLGDLASC